MLGIGLMKVLFWLLHPDPRSRATVRDLQKDKWTNQAVDDAQLNFDVVLGMVNYSMVLCSLGYQYHY